MKDVNLGWFSLGRICALLALILTVVLFLTAGGVSGVALVVILVLLAVAGIF